jgi:hypothetical protein
VLARAAAALAATLRAALLGAALLTGGLTGRPASAAAQTPAPQPPITPAPSTPAPATTPGAGAVRPVTADTAALAGAVRVFLDCPPFTRACDFDFIRTELGWVTWVRDRFDADVLLLVTTLRAANGGQEFTVSFLGQKRFAGRVDTLRHSSLPNDPDDRQRRDLVRTFALGLAPLAARTPVRPLLSVTFQAPRGLGGGRTSPQSVRDPWNFWLFRTSVNGFVNGEQLQRFANGFASVTANRITANTKITTGVSADVNTQRFTLSDGSIFTNTLRGYGLNALVTRGLGPHWSLGGKIVGQYSDFFNYDANLRVAPAIEYNFFPYAQATRRQLTVLYAPGVSRFDYQEVTIFGRAAETRPDHLLIIATNARQPWGSVNVTATGTQFLDNPRQNNLQLRGQVDLRLGRGLSINVGGSASRVRDQIYLPRGTLSDDQILVRRRALATGYRYFANVGLSYTFGSIYNTVVNPRFQSFGTQGGGFFFSF